MSSSAVLFSLNMSSGNDTSSSPELEGKVSSCCADVSRCVSVSKGLDLVMGLVDRRLYLFF